MFPYCLGLSMLPGEEVTIPSADSAIDENDGVNYPVFTTTTVSYNKILIFKILYGIHQTKNHLTKWLSNSFNFIIWVSQANRLRSLLEKGKCVKTHKILDSQPKCQHRGTRSRIKLGKICTKVTRIKWKDVCNHIYATFVVCKNALVFGLPCGEYFWPLCTNFQFWALNHVCVI